MSHEDAQITSRYYRKQSVYTVNILGLYKMFIYFITHDFCVFLSVTLLHEPAPFFRCFMVAMNVSVALELYVV